MSDRDPRQLSDALEKETNELERESSELADQIDATRQDWERKRADDGVPGAPPPSEGAPEAEPTPGAEAKDESGEASEAPGEG